MNPTKNIKYLEIEKDLFDKLCDAKFQELVETVRSSYEELKSYLESITSRWMKIKDTDIYFDTKNKVIIQDTRSVLPTDLSIHYSQSYQGTVNYFKEISEDSLEELKKKAEELNLILPSEFDNEILGVLGGPLDINLVKKIFDDDSCPFTDEEGNFKVKGNGVCPFFVTNSLIYQGRTGGTYYCTQVDSAVKVSAHVFNSNNTVVELIINYGLYPAAADDNHLKLLKDLHDLFSKGVDINDYVQVKGYILDNQVDKIGECDFRKEAIESDVETEEIDMNSNSIIGQCLKEYFDGCDYIRARIQKYNSDWYLSDEGKGHWELWGEPEEQATVKKKRTRTNTKTKGKESEVDKDSESNSDDETIEKENVSARKKIIKLHKGVIARNPIADIKHDAVVGIDFGTKSTIVALQDGDESIYPLRVGMADYSIAPRPEHYENPTVMQFVDLGNFISKYEKSAGRPMTSWDDLLISHEAFRNLIGANESTDYVSFTTDIKQWAAGRYNNNGKNGHLIIKDRKGNRYDIDNYMELSDEDVDLIEIYAYYIGLFINNMHTGIYLDYVLSFPETFSLEVKQHILESFTRGIKKSIPAIVLESDEFKDEFRVRQGPSEPAAYAACALEQYGIEPTNEGVFYGIFDFGGGTSDFDYGIWKNAPDDEFTYNYVIKHYGSGGDKTLGGENILQLLAYNVFSDTSIPASESESNLDIVRKHKFVFFRPDEGELKSGTEALNSNSESALLNTKQMMEALRPIWEEWNDFRDWFNSTKEKKKNEIEVEKNVYLCYESEDSIKVKLNLFNDSGREEVELSVDMKMINRIINDRIETGVRNFFEGLKLAYSKWEHKEDEKIHLFLAGNSSKSGRVIKFFVDYMKIYSEEMFNARNIDAESNSMEVEDVEEIPDSIDKIDFGSIFGTLFGTYSDVLSSSMGKSSTAKDSETDNVLELLQNEHFELYPPLGTELARKIQRDNNVIVSDEDLMAPTGKTGVAFGLVMCREGSMIKVESEKKKNDQIKLNYYIGVNYRKKFKVIFDRATEYNQWHKFSKVAADTETFEFYYTELPEVVSNEVDVIGNKSVHKHKCLLDNVTVDANIYFKFTKPNELEYVVASEDHIKEEQFMSKVYKVKL